MESCRGGPHPTKVSRELRTFNDSYSLDEPEPGLGPEILNFVGVPIVEPGMAGEGENVEAILQAYPPQAPLGPEVVAPDPGAQNINGGGK